MRPHHAHVTAQHRRAFADPLAGVALLLDALALVLLLAQPVAELDRVDASTVGGLVLGASFPLIGWIIAARRPDNAMGWIFLGIGLSQALVTFAQEYAAVGLLVAPGSLPAADVMAWLGTWTWAPGFTLLLTTAVLLFPDGRLPSPRWRPVLWGAAIALAALVIPVAIVAWPYRGVALLGQGPPDIGGGTEGFVSVLLALQGVGLLLLLATSAASILGLVVRFRRSGGAERAQLKWFVAAGVVEVLTICVATLIPLPWPALNLILAVLVSPLLPVAAGLAILRYRLYDIDRIVSRTVSYAAVTGLLALLFVVLVLALQALLAPFTAGNGLAVAASTLVVAAAFQPLRRRVQRLVDRRFDRARYDAEGVVADLAGRVRDEVELEALIGEVLRTAQLTVAPASTSVWLRFGGDG